MILFRAALGAVLLGVFAAGASAQTVIVNDLVSSSSNPVQTWSGLTKVGQSFSATASGSITSLALNLTFSNAGAFPVYAVELWSTDGQPTPLPSTLLATFVSNQQWNPTLLSSPLNPANTITFTSSSFGGGSYDVVSGTSYWIVVTSSSGSSKAWGVSSSDIGDTATYNGVTWSAASLSGSLGMSISVQSAIPEPGTSALIAGMLALGGAEAMRRRRRTRSGASAP